MIDFIFKIIWLQFCLRVLLWFRIYNTAYVGYIAKTVLQIGLHLSHIGSVRFLWFQKLGNIDFENFENNELIKLQFCRILLGSTCTSFLSFATIIHHMDKYSTVDKEFCWKIFKLFCLDDLSTADNIGNNIDEVFDYFCKCKDWLEAGSDLILLYLNKLLVKIMECLLKNINV